MTAPPFDVDVALILLAASLANLFSTIGTKRTGTILLERAKLDAARGAIEDARQVLRIPGSDVPVFSASVLACGNRFPFQVGGIERSLHCTRLQGYDGTCSVSIRVVQEDPRTWRPR